MGGMVKGRARGFDRSRALHLGPRRFFARLAWFVVDCHACRSQAGQQNCPYRGRIESNILSFWRMRLGALQSHRQVQMLAKMFDDAIDLLVGHCSQPLLTRCLPGRFPGLNFYQLV
jgi:hypothetical protein